MKIWISLVGLLSDELGKTMKSKETIYNNILSELMPLYAELDKIDSELRTMAEFDEAAWSKRFDKTLERTTYLRREIAWWESELAEVS